MSKEKEKDAKIADAVLEAAQKVFERKGAKHATMEEIAAEAKLDAKKVKAVFPNVEAVIQEVLDRDVEETSELFTRTINDRGKADVKLTRLVRELLTRYQHSYVLSCVVSEGVETGDENEPFVKAQLTKRHVDRYRQNTAILGRLVAQGQSEGLFTDVDPVEAAYLLRGMIGAAVRFRKVTEKRDDMRDHADIIMRIFLKGLLR
ncbi:MAG: TetR family transcriptional regulator [Candidatus Sumerlaea chitinivorans]|nr:TetR family transcriptional regulator [Candidatus Sumerlaea chitinivorans]